MDARKFYNDLWIEKVRNDTKTQKKRDRFHELILDPIFNPNANPRSEVALSLLGKGERLLDIGCWDGLFLEKIRMAGLYQELTGIDIVESGIKLVREKGFDAKMVDLNAGVLPFPDNHFDAVTILAVIEHIFEPFSIVREIRRILKPGGILIIDVPNVASLTNRIRILIGRIPITSNDQGWDGGYLHYFTKHALDQFLKNEGFEILVRKTTGGFPQLREWWISLLGGEMVYLCKRR